MICLLCGRKLRWWENSVSSVISANRYHWVCLDSGGSNYRKRHGIAETISQSRVQQSRRSVLSRLTDSDTKGGQMSG